MSRTRKARDRDPKLKRPKKLYPCPNCASRFPNKELNDHVATHTTDDLLPWKCTATDDCQLAFSTRPELSAHKRTAHIVRIRATCPVCECQFRDKYQLNKHQNRIHHVRVLDEEPKEIYKPHKCDKCDKTFGKKFALMEHKVSHGEGEPLKCDTCEATFIHKKSLDRHILNHSGIEYPCTEPGCEKIFNRSDKLVAHIRTVHNKSAPAVKKKPKGNQSKNSEDIPCVECGKMIKKYNMKLHVLTHTGEVRNYI